MEGLQSRLLSPRLFRTWPGGLWPALVEAGEAADGAPELRGGGAVVSFGGAADARGAHRGALPRLPGGALRRVGIALAVPRSYCIRSVEGRGCSFVRRV